MGDPWMVTLLAEPCVKGNVGLPRLAWVKVGDPTGPNYTKVCMTTWQQ